MTHFIIVNVTYIASMSTMTRLWNRLRIMNITLQCILTSRSYLSSNGALIQISIYGLVCQIVLQCSEYCINVHVLIVIHLYWYSSSNVLMYKFEHMTLFLTFLCTVRVNGDYLVFFALLLYCMNENKWWAHICRAHMVSLHDRHTKPLSRICVLCQIHDWSL
jgi:hypothetical protein